jgi:hypothetical protein
MKTNNVKTNTILEKSSSDLDLSEYKEKEA